MNGFKNYYLWAAKVKFYVAIYFMAITILVGLINFCFGNNTIEFFKLLEIMGVSAIISLTHVFLLPDSTDYSKSIFTVKSLVWLTISIGATVLVSNLGKWFYGLPIWTIFAFAIIMIIACIAMLVGLRIEQERDTTILNNDLKHYKNSFK